MTRGVKKQQRLHLPSRQNRWSLSAVLSALFFLCLILSTANFYRMLTFVDGRGGNAGVAFLPGRQRLSTTTITVHNHHPQRPPNDQIFQMLSEANIDIRRLNLATIPTWGNVEEWYGSGDPVIVGLETCEPYRAQVPQNRRIIAPAGMFHSGTNVVASLLHSNCFFGDKDKYNGDDERASTSHVDSSGGGGKVIWQVPWGKHVLASLREEHSVTMSATKWNSEHTRTLPIVMIRDPYLWMERMCIQPYAAKWHHKESLHCPNLVPTREDYEHVFSFREPHVPVRIKFDSSKKAVVWDSLVHLWSDWYRQYLSEEAYPRLMVRLEDLMFRPKPTLEKICTCAGGTFESSDFHYVMDSAKFGPGHANQYTSWVGTLQQYNEHHKTTKSSRGMTAEDYTYARQNLDEQLMELFHYQHPSTP